MSGLGVNYSSVSKSIYALLTRPSRVWSKAEEVLEAVGGVVMAQEAVESVDIKVEVPRGLLHAQSVMYTQSFSTKGRGEVKMKIKDLRITCVIGLHPHERAENQRLEVDLELEGWGGMGHKAFTDYAYSVSVMLPSSSYV
jgi:dihydroneopterin aldolase/2-amino-4-hydroxy-6-hydroxymethyldihydropteridine diphosphokinase/dihydropteroate synthase